MCSSGDMIVDRQTHIDLHAQTDTLITLLLAPCRGRYNYYRHPRRRRQQQQQQQRPRVNVTAKTVAVDEVVKRPPPSLSQVSLKRRPITPAQWRTIVAGYLR